MVDVRGGKIVAYGNWVQYDLTSQIDGALDEFTIPAAFQSGKILVFLNGIERIVGASKDYIESSSTKIKFNYVPDVGDTLEVWIIKS